MNKEAKTKEKEIIPIFFAVDNNYVPILHVAIKSLVAQASDKYKYNLHILCDDVSPENQNSFSVFNSNNVKVIINDMSEVIADVARKLHAKYYARATYFRVYIPDLFPEYDKAIYLDCDVALTGDISELFNYELGDKYLGASTCEIVNVTPVFIAYVEKFLGIKTPYYFNAGVFALNCKKLRSVKFKDQFFELLDKIKLEIAPDQDYYNILCYGKIELLPLAWNKIPIPNDEIKPEDIRLIHYNLALKPWRYDNIMYEEIFWKYAKETVFYDKIIKDKKRVINVDKIKDNNRFKALKRMAKNYAKGDTLAKILARKKAPDRVAVLEKINELEKKGVFDVDVEQDPTFNGDLSKFDYLDKKLTSKIKAWYATRCGKRFYEKQEKQKVIIVDEITGAENLNGFNGGAVITCNHMHPYDNYVVHAGLVKALGKFRLWKIVRDGNWAFKGVTGIMLRNANTLPISEKNPRLMVKCMKATRTLLERGEKVLIYPEQAMWWNYRKPRPLKDGAFMIAAKAKVPIIPCFITLKDSNIIGKDGFPVQEFTLNVLPPIPYSEDAAAMKKRNEELWKNVYDRVYGGHALA